MILVGLGSPFGDDQVGWRVAQALEDMLQGSADAEPVRVLCLDRPGPALLDAIAGRDEAILVDATADGSPPGTVHQVAAETVMAEPRSSSSHGLGPGHALQLGHALGILPPRLSIYLVSIDPSHTGHPDGADLTPPVAAAVLPLAQEILGAARGKRRAP